MTGPEAKAALARLAAVHGWAGGGQTAFAKLADVEIRRLRSWLAGAHPFGGDALCLLLAMERDPGLAAALQEEYRPSGLQVSGSLDRLLWALRRDTSLVWFLLWQAKIAD